jgi:hypothetical protein
MIRLLKKTDRTLLEMHTGMLLFGIACQVVGAWLTADKTLYAKSLWFGILFALAGSIHMARTLDRALADSVNAKKIIMRGYIIRYVLVVLIMVIIAVTGVMNPLVVFLGYMSLKITAYLQPLTHKFYNFLFHETDPVPEALPDEEEPDAEEAVYSEDRDLPKN